MHKSMADGTIFSKVDNTLVPNLIELCDNMYIVPKKRCFVAICLSFSFFLKTGRNFLNRELTVVKAPENFVN